MKKQMIFEEKTTGVYQGSSWYGNELLKENTI